MTIPIVPPFVPSAGPIANITPFTYRDGLSHLARLERLAKYINRILIPYVQTNYDALADSITDDINQLVVTFNGIVEQIINDSIELQDVVLQGIISDAESDVRVLLDSIYASVTDVATLEETVSEIPGEIVAATKPLNTRNPITRTFNVREYGAIGNGVADDTAAFDAAADAAEAIGGGVVEVPSGNYIVSQYVHRHRVSLRGEGVKTTTLTAKAGTNNSGLIVMEAGPVQYADILNITLVGAGNVGQNAIYFEATGAGGTPNHGGFWNSQLNNVDISGFDGHCIYLKGGWGPGYDYLLPHQFNVFTNVNCFAKHTYKAFVTYGQVGQLEVIGGLLEGIGVNEADNTPAVEIGDGAYLINFRGTSFQSRKNGISVLSGISITFDSCYYESLGRTFAVDTTDGVAERTSVSIINGNFSNAGGFGLTDNSGYLIRGDGNSHISIMGTLSIQGEMDNTFIAVDNCVLDARNASVRYQGGTGFTQSGATKQRAIDGDGVVNIESGLNTYLVNTSATPLDTINSPAAKTGDTVYFRVLGGGTLSIASGGNIDLATRTNPVVLNGDQIATFVKFDLATNWVLVNVSGE